MLAYTYRMKKIEIRSEYPCLIKWKGGEEFLDEATSLFFSTPELLFVYPATGKRDDIAFVLDLSQPDKNFCQIFNLEEKNLCLLTKSSSNIKIKEELSANGKQVKLILSNSNAEFHTDERIASVSTLPPKTYEFTNYENFVILKIKSLSAEQIVLFNTVFIVSCSRRFCNGPKPKNQFFRGMQMIRSTLLSRNSAVGAGRITTAVSEP